VSRKRRPERATRSGEVPPPVDPRVRVAGPFRVDGGLTFVLSGELDVAGADEVDRRLRDVGGGQVVLDLRALRFIDSTGLAVLYRCHERLTEAGGERLALTVAPGQVLRMLELTHLGDVFSLRLADAEADGP
jgi:anti-sigma B factor antagonist